MPKKRMHKKGKGILSSANNLLKKTHLISSALGLASLIPNPLAKVGGLLGSSIASSLGYGRHKKRGPKKHHTRVSKTKFMVI